jgi:type IV secretion system protein VirD4
MRGLQGQMKALEAKIGALEVPRETAGDGFDGGGKRRDEIENLASDSENSQLGDKASLGDYQAGTERVEKFMEEAARG